MARHINGVKSLQVEIGSLIRLLFFIKIISDARGQTISLSCPSLQEGSIVGVSCSVPTSICAYSVVLFDFETKDGTTPVRLCAIPSTDTCGQEFVGVMNCSCVSSGSSAKNYKLNFLGDKSKYEGGKLTCSVNCASTGGSCDRLQYTLTSTSPTTTTVGSGNVSVRNNVNVLATAIIAGMSGVISFILTNLNG